MHQVDVFAWQAMRLTLRFLEMHQLDVCAAVRKHGLYGTARITGRHHRG